MTYTDYNKERESLFRKTKMKNYSSYKVKLHITGKYLDDTLRCYREALSWYLNTITEIWDEVSALTSTKKRLNYLEKVTVPTRYHPNPRFPFVGLFENVPCYMRRAAMAEALGLVVGYHSLPQEQGSRRDPSTKPNSRWAFPTLYRDNMYIRTGTYNAKLKVYKDGHWTWVNTEFRKSDVDYILHHCQEMTECSPILRKRGKEWFLDFPFEEIVELPEDIGDRVLGVDLGINSAAVCSVVDKSGNIYSRNFLSLSVEEDLLKKRIGRIKKSQQHGNYKVKKPWATVNLTNARISEKTAHFIIEKAMQHQVRVIVMENLKEMSTTKRGSMAQRLTLWRRREIFERVMYKAHRAGIHVSMIDPRGTSKYAFDGSGIVRRDSKNYALSYFQNGKIYNADLNASYNIGAKFWLREIEKSIPPNEWLDMEAKVPSLSRRSTHTLSTLISVSQLIQH